MVSVNSVARFRFSPWLILAGAIAIPLLYVPTLATRFDFIDDGNLVYSAPPMPLGNRIGLVWDKIVANYDHLGPFRPVLWAHWEFVADLARNDAFTWRLIRLGWSILAAAMLLALMRELRLPAWPSLLATALAMWNPYRNEIWTSLTLSEGVAMPYALAALWCAARANRSRHAWLWDIASALCVLAAMGCKNTFAAIVPAQLYLRMCADGVNLREGISRHWRRIVLLSLTLLLPIGHYVYFRLNWHPGQYPPTGVTAAQLGRMISALGGAMSLDFLAAGVAAALLALVVWGRQSFCHSERSVESALSVRCLRSTRNERMGHSEIRHATDSGQQIPRCARTDKVGWITAALLVVCGVAIYLPMPAVSGRYTMPAVWGLDLALAGLLALLGTVELPVWRKLAMAAVVGGLIAVAIANVGRQAKVAARINVLWQALEFVEKSAGNEARIAWVSGPQLNVEEGIHFRWHLQARGHDNVVVDLFDEHGVAEERCELPPVNPGSGSSFILHPSSFSLRPSSFAITGTPQPPPTGDWALVRHFEATFWLGRRHFDCYLWEARSTVSGTPRQP